MNAKYVELIAVVAESGSLGAAAQRLNKSQPAVSKALQAAEAEIGCQIFSRTPAGVVPTVEGQRVVDRCTSIRRDLHLLSEDIDQLRGDVTGTLNLVVSPLSAVHIVPDVLRRYLRRYPDVQVQVIGGHSGKAFQMLRTRQADYVIGPAPGNGQDPGLRSRSLIRTGLTIATGMKSRYLDETDPRVLQNAQWLMIGPRDATPRYAAYFERFGLEVPQPVVCSDSILTILSMLERGEYLCSFPSELFSELSDRWSVRKLNLSEEIEYVSLALTAEVNRVPTVAALAFEDIVETVCMELAKEVS